MDGINEKLFLDVLEKSVQSIMFEPSDRSTLYKLRDIIDMNFMKMNGVRKYSVKVGNEMNIEVNVDGYSFNVEFDEEHVYIERLCIWKWNTDI